MSQVQTDDLEIPPFLKRTADSKVPAKEVDMASVSSSTAKNKKAVVKAMAVKAKASKIKAPAKEKSADVYGYRDGSLKSQAAKMYALKGGATLEEVKDKTGSVQLNLLKDLESRGFKVKRVKEAGDGKRQVTRYFLTGK